MSVRVRSPHELLVALGHIQVAPLRAKRTELHGSDYEAAVAEGARKWISEFGKRPSKESGNAIDYVGFRSTWAGIDSAFYKGSNGVRKIGGLRAFLDEQGVGVVDYEAAVADGARRYIAEHGKRPSQKSGDATAYVGFPATWGSISATFRKGSNGVRKLGGLRAFLDEQGIG